MAKEFGAEVVEYINSAACYWKNSEDTMQVPFENQMEQFKQFVSHSQKYPSLSTNSHQKIVILEDIPPVVLMEDSNRSLFKEIVKLFFCESTFPLVWILCDTNEGTNEMKNYLGDIIHSPYFKQIK